MNAITKILAPIDFSDQTPAALQQAAELARTLEAELFVMHALDLPTYAVDSGLGMIAPTMAAQIQPDVEARIRSLVAGLGDVTPVVREGRAHVEVNAFAADAEIDLIVMPTHGRTGLSHMLLGSTAERVVREAPCSVLVVREGVETHDPKRVLLPVDLDDAPESTLDQIEQWLPAARTDITLLHAIDRPYTLELGMGNVAPETARSVRNEVESRLASITPTRVRRTVVREGVPHAEITSYIKEAGIELVVMPTHGRIGLAHLVIGSTAERVVRGATCRVLVVR